MATGPCCASFGDVVGVLVDHINQQILVIQPDEFGRAGRGWGNIGLWVVSWGQRPAGGLNTFAHEGWFVGDGENGDECRTQV